MPFLCLFITSLSFFTNRLDVWIFESVGGIAILGIYLKESECEKTQRSVKALNLLEISDVKNALGGA